MKKTLTRMMSLLLVLVMMLGVMPMASAAVNYPIVVSNRNLKVGESTNISCNLLVDNEGEKDDADWLLPETATYEWSISDGTNTTTHTGKSFNFTPAAAGEYAVTLTRLYIPAKEHADPHTYTNVSGGNIVVKDAYTISIPETLSLKAGTTKAISATVTKNGAADSTATVEWFPSSSAIGVLNGSVVATEAATGTYTLTAKVKVGGEYVAEDSCTVTILSGYTVTVTPATKTAKPGETVTFNAVVKDVDEKTITPAANTLTWASSDNEKVFSQGSGKFVIGNTASGNYNITATYTVDGKSYTSEAAVLKVQDDAYKVTVTPATATLPLSGEKQLSAAVTTKAGAAHTPESGTLTWHTSDATIATVTNGLVKASATKTGTVTITARYTKAEGQVYEGTATITVGKATITFGSSSTFSYASDSDNTVILTPSFDIDGDGSSDLGDTGLTYEYTKLGSTGDISGKVNSDNKVEVTADAREAAALAFKLVVKDASGSVVAEGTASVSFYTTNNISVTMASGISTLKFSEYTHLKEGRPALAARILDGLDSKVYGANDKIAFSNLTVSTEGTLSGSTLDVNNEVLVGTNGAGIAGLVFTPGTSGRADFNYTLYADSISDLPLCKGNIIISYGDTADIEYYAAYNKSVTFKESDFAAFWKKADKNSDLSYVKITTMPVYGTLYTSTSAITANKATTSQSFYYGTVPYGGKDLGSLTFVPPTTKLNEYDVYVTFTAYGKSALDTVTGRVVIHVNDVTNAISSRGITFGTVYDDNDTYVTTDDKTYADQIAETYWSKTGYNLGYVTFTLPAAEQATLYYKVTDSKVAQSTQLAYGAKLYYKSNSSSVSKLESAALIPAADFSGQLVLSFKAYDEAGGNETNGTITFNVTKKTASAVFSDVTAKSYGWASDSVDFLYYEGTAQGSNGKYNPAANITRQDFMLMLYRAFLAEDYGTFAPTTNFPDVVKGTSDYSKEIYQAVGVAKYLGIAQGTNDRFNPKANITRQEAMVLIYRTLETINKDLRTDSGVKLTSMKDASKISNWATAAISNLVSHGVIKGNNDYIKPAANITRAEMAAILHRVITY